MLDEDSADQSHKVRLDLGDVVTRREEEVGRH